MVTLFKKSRIGLVALGAMALMAIAGWQFGTNGTQEVFSDKKMALENAIAGSGGIKCYSTYSNCYFWNCVNIWRCQPGGSCYSVSADTWSGAGSC
jgi:hypothetical protein